MSPEPLYRLDAIDHDYGGAFHLRPGDLEIFPGEVVALLGPTGAGKSTLLRLLAGVEAPAKGAVRFLDRRLDDPATPLSVRREITLVFQRPLMLAGSVRANVEYGLRLRGRSHRDPNVDRLLDELGLAAIADREARTLSVGQQQLVAQARGMVLEPRSLLVDEPTAHLDPAAVARVERLVAGEARRRGTTVVWATHNLFQARRVAHRVGLLLEGRLVEIAATRTFFEAPADPRTAAFVRGEMIY